MNSFLTEYHEQVKTAEDLTLTDGSVKDQEIFDDPEAFIITFFEDDAPKKVPSLEPDVSEFFEVDQDELMDPEDMKAMPFKLPGATDYVEDDLEDEDEEEEEEEVITDWENDRDPKHFMNFILKSYPSGIPKHDGRSTLGCERAIVYLKDLNKQISEALRLDNDDCLDLKALEGMRVNMVRDVISLQNHVKKLNKKHKKAELIQVPSDLPGLEIIHKKAEFEKEATTAKLQLVMTPFQRAITGIIVNSVVSAGKPLEDVYSFLNKKYAFTPREELEIMQILMDMGQPIFKDRGMIGEKDVDDKGQGVDFIKNYLG